MKLTGFKTFTVVAGLLAASSLPAQTILRVDADGIAAGGGDGSSWAMAYSDLREALIHARDNAGTFELWVAEGTYIPTEPFLSTFPIYADTHVYGGFAGFETSRDQRDWQAHPTVLSGNIGDPGDQSDNLRQVVGFGITTGDAATLDGFEIRDGWAPGEGGAGIVMIGDKRPVIANCRFVNNVAAYGAAIYVQDNGSQNPQFTMTNCEFIANRAEGDMGTYTLRPDEVNLGGAVTVHDAYGGPPVSVRLVDCYFEGNSSTDGASLGHGGAVGVEGGDVRIEGCRFENNTANWSGGAIHGTEDGRLDILASVFTGNTARINAGAVLADGAGRRLTCVNSSFHSNIAIGSAGGAVLTRHNDVFISGSMFNSNVAQQLGGACLFTTPQRATITNCTYYANRTNELHFAGGGLYLSSNTDTVALRNNIFWANSSPQGTVEQHQIRIVSPGDTVAVDSNCIQGLTTGLSNLGTGNISQDPEFFDPSGLDDVSGNEDDDLRVGSDAQRVPPVSSPCANAGNLSLLPNDELDVDDDGNTAEDLPLDVKGQPRVNQSLVDMGAFEYHTDDDNDFVRNSADNCLDLHNPSQSDADADGFGDACDPSITSISPASGPEGIIVTIRGSGFLATPAVFFGASASADVNVLDTTNLTARVPERSPGAVDVRVANPNGAQGLAVGAFTYTELLVTVGQQIPVPDFLPGYTPTRVAGPVWLNPEGDAFSLYAVDDNSEIVIDWTDGADTQRLEYGVSYPGSFDPEHRIDITAGQGGEVPSGATDLEIFDVEKWNSGVGLPQDDHPLNENDELGLVYYAEGSSTELRVFALRVDDSFAQHVLLKHRIAGELRFQVYQVLPGSSYLSQGTLEAKRRVGSQLEPFYPLNRLIAESDPPLTPGDGQFDTQNWARYWLNPDRSTEVFAVNAHPDADPEGAIHSTITVRWPTILTSEDFGDWVPDSTAQPAALPYRQRFEVWWDRETSETITIGDGDGAPLPLHWDYDRVAPTELEVFDVELSRDPTLAAGKRGNANEERGLVYLSREADRLNPQREDWRVFSLQHAVGVWDPNASEARRGGEGFVLVKYTADDGEIEFASFRVEPGVIDRADVVVGSRLVPHYPLDDILFGLDLTQPATVDILPESTSSGWWVNDPAGEGSHIYAVNKGRWGESTANPHVAIEWIIPEDTLRPQDPSVRTAYRQRFDIVWPHEVPGAQPDADYRVLRIQGMSYDGHAFIPTSPDQITGVFDKVYYQPQVFEGVGASDIRGGWGEGSTNDAIQTAGDINPNDEHALYLGGHLYAGRDDLHTPQPPYVLLGHRETPTGPLVFEAFKVERDVTGKRLFAGQLVQLPIPYLFLEPDNPILGQCGSEFVNSAGQPIDFGWTDPNGNVWAERSWPPPESPALDAFFDYKEWWFPGDQIAGNGCRDWIEDIPLATDWPQTEGIGPGQYLRLSVGEAIDRSANEGLRLLYSRARGASSDAAAVSILHGFSGSFEAVSAENQPVEGPAVTYRKFVSAIGDNVQASPCAGDRWASVATTNGSNPTSVAVEIYKVECPPVRGRIVPVGPSCFFSERAGLYFWPLARDPEDYVSDSDTEVFTSGGLYDEANLPIELIDSLYDGTDLRFEWQYQSAADFNAGLDNWLPVDNDTNKHIIEGPGIATLQDRYYRTRYYNHPACSCDPPPEASDDVTVQVVTLGDTLDIQQFSVNQRVGGGEWVHLGTHAISGNAARVEVRVRGPNAYADAALFVPVAVDGVAIPEAQRPSIIVDDDDANNQDPSTSSSSSGTWSVVSAPATHRGSASYTTSASATYTLTLQPPADATLKEYDVYVRWPAGAGGVEIHEPSGTWYSPWTEPSFVPGWLKRVLQGADLENFKLETFHEDGETYTSVLSLIGARAEDAIAQNCDPANLEQLGLLELYTNVLLRARSFSVDYGIENVEANQQLLLAASRIAQLYLFLGHEAYADALDPTIGTAFHEGNDLEPERYHAFRNQAEDLLAEEIVLMRGRALQKNLLDFNAPVYNRYSWNFTDDLAKAIYTACYYPTAGIITAEDAEQAFPVGHGDAYGHYLSAVRSFYDLLESPFFAWTNDVEHVLVNGNPVLVNFLHVRRLATAAAAFSRAGRDTVALEFRRQYRADPEEELESYLDETTDEDLLADGDSFADPLEAQRAWGVHDWATRAATASYLNWATIAARLPAESQEVGLKKVDRTTVLELDEITAHVADITKQIDTVDAGLNPLGMARDVVPFDIDLASLQNCETHFEQALEKAVNAIGNAVAILNFANLSKNRLRQQQDELLQFERSIEEQEQRFTSRMIEIFGRPYEGDPAAIDPDGPDLVHFAYVDVGQVTGREEDFVETLNLQFPWKQRTVNKEATSPDLQDLEEILDVGTIEYHFAREGGFLTPLPSWGRRPEEGRIQQSLRQIHAAKGRLDQSLLTLDRAIQDIEARIQFYEDTTGLQAERIDVIDTRTDKRVSLADEIQTIRNNQRLAEAAAEVVAEGLGNVIRGLPTNIIAGLATGGDLMSPARGVLGIAATAAKAVHRGIEYAVDLEVQSLEEDIQRHARLQEIELVGVTDELSKLQIVQDVEAMVRSLPGAALQVELAKRELAQAVTQYSSVLGEGVRLGEERERFRRHTVRLLRKYRHDDLSFRLFHNDALQKYRAAFDLSAIYSYLATQAFDYETNLLGTGHRIGRFDDIDEALEAVLRARSPGAIIGQSPSGGSGLTGVLGELSTAFTALKADIRFCNTSPERREFSLRQMLVQLPAFGSQPGQEWREFLLSQRVDLHQQHDIKRLAQLNEWLGPDLGETAHGLVLRFPTGIYPDLNFFLNRSLGGGQQFSPEHLTTKIFKCGVFFENYPAGIGRLSETPFVYLIPAGASVMRSPIGTAPGVPKPIRLFHLVDQLSPRVLPDFLDQGTGQWMVDELDDVATNPDWRPGFASLGQVRKVNPFVAGNARNPQPDIPYSGLVGRTAWNSEWILVIPGRALGAPGNDPELGIELFIDNVTDILLRLETYSYENPF